MNSIEIKLLKTRLDALEAQQAVMAGFVSIALQFQSCQLPELQRPALHATYDQLFEKLIANLLSSDLCFSDASIQAVEHLKDSLLSTLEPKSNAH